MRPRKRDRHLPARVYAKHGAYWYVHRGKWTRIGSTLPDALDAYAKLVAPVASGGMPDLIRRVFDHIRPNLAENTIKQYEQAARRLSVILAEFSPDQVQPKHVAAIKMELADTPNMANRLLSFLRVVFQHAVEWQECDSNPCVGIKRHAEGKRDRYMTHEEFSAIRAHAPPTLQCIMDLCYLTGQRIGDVLQIKLADISSAGIDFEQQKTGKKLRVAMTAELAEVIERAKGLHASSNVRSMYLLWLRLGKPYSYGGVRDAFRQAAALAGVEDARIHDLRAKSITDASRQGLDAQKLAGHTSGKMTERYIRLRDLDTAEPPSIRQALDSWTKPVKKSRR